MPNGLTGYAQEEFEKILLATLRDPVVRGQLAEATGQILASPEFRKAVRPTLMEAAFFIGVGVFGGYALYDLIIRR